MDSFATKKYLPVKKTSIQYQPLYSYPPTQTHTNFQHNFSHHIPVHTSRAVMSNEMLLNTAHLLHKEENSLFTYLRNSIDKMSISHQIWINTFPLDYLYNKQTQEWSINWLRYLANFLVIAGSLIIYILQILYYQDLKICRDFDYKFRNLNENTTMCSFLNECSLKTPIANEWRLQEYAWLRVALSTIQYIPFVFLFLVDWYTIRNDIKYLDKNIKYYKTHSNWSQENYETKPDAYRGFDTNRYLFFFKMLVFSCCFVVGCVAFAIDYEAQRASKDCVYKMKNGNSEPKDWAFFIPTQKAPSDFPLAFLIMGSFFTIWSFNFCVYASYRILMKMNENSNTERDKAFQDKQKTESEFKKHDQKFKDLMKQYSPDARADLTPAPPPH